MQHSERQVISYKAAHSGPGTTTASPRRQLAAFLARYEPKTAALAGATLAKLRAQLPGAHQLVYDNFNALVVGFCSSPRASTVICSMGVYPRWVNLYFFCGSDLPDPEHLLAGSGSMVRRIKVEDASRLDSAAVKAILADAVKLTDPPLDRTARATLVIRAVSKKQRSRRSPARP